MGGAYGDGTKCSEEVGGLGLVQKLMQVASRVFMGQVGCERECRVARGAEL